MRDLWKRLDAGGADWISIWDHLYEAPRLGGVLPHFEALSTLGSLVADTRNARIGCLVFYVGYRNAGLLAKAATTLDHFSGGRFTLGLGSGWHEQEAAAFGYDFPSLGERFDMLEESVERILEYRAAGARGLNMTMRAPILHDALDAYLEEVIPTVQRETA